MRKMAKELAKKKESVRKIVTMKLKLINCKMASVHVSKDAIKAKRFEKWRQMIPLVACGNTS